ncbi:MAG: iron-containing alcohol dehydrogenase [Acetivibrio sp.]
MATYYYLPTRNVFGEGAVNEAGILMKSLRAKKTLIVTDRSMIELGIVERVEQIFEKEGLKTSVFSGVNVSLSDITVNEGVKAYEQYKCDSILSLGGGTCHDCGKGIGLLITNGGKIQDYEGVDKSKYTMLPLMAINTTAGTASEITRFCTIMDTVRNVKMTIIDWRITPQIAINDPELMRGMSPELTAATGMAALTNAMEAYVSTDANPLTDSAALMAISMIARYLPKAVANGDYMKARNQMAYAQYLAGIAFNNASLGYVHAMANQLGGAYGLPHGICNAILLPYVEEFNLIGNINRFRNIAEAMGERVEGLSTLEGAYKSIEFIKTLSRQIEIPSTLKELGVNPQDFERMAEGTLLDSYGNTNPRKATKEQLIEIFEKAYGKEGTQPM